MGQCSQIRHTEEVRSGKSLTFESPIPKSSLCQLHKAIQQKKAFVGFGESEISHLPCVSNHTRVSSEASVIVLITNCHRTYRFSPGLGMDALGYDLKSVSLIFRHGTSLTFTTHSPASFSSFYLPFAMHAPRIRTSYSTLPKHHPGIYVLPGRSAILRLSSSGYHLGSSLQF